MGTNPRGAATALPRDIKPGVRNVLPGVPDRGSSGSSASLRRLSAPPVEGHQEQELAASQSVSVEITMKQEPKTDLPSGTGQEMTLDPGNRPGFSS